MLKKEIINYFYLLLVLITSCTNKGESPKDYFIRNNVHWQNNKTYQLVHRLATDSIDKWIKLDLKGWEPFKSNIYAIDKKMYFNTDSTRFRSYIFNIIPDFSSDTTSDYIYWLYGEKINNQWYFWNSDMLVLPRDYTKSHYSFYEHPSFEQLSDIAMGHIIEVYLKDESKWPWEKNRYIINEDFLRNSLWMDIVMAELIN